MFEPGITMKGIVVGVGFMGRTHLESYSRQKDARIVALVDRNNLKTAKLLAAQYGCEAFAELDEAIEAVGADFVDVCLPTRLHKEAAVLAMTKGAHVLVEKPFALNLDDIDEMITASGSFGKRLMVAHVCRFMPQYMFLKKSVDERALGRPIFFSAWRLSEAPSWSWNNWLQDRKLSGGTSLDLSIHDIDIANWLFGTPAICRYHESNSDARPGCSHVLSQLSYADGVTVSIEGSHLMPKGYSFTDGFRMICEKGVWEWHTANTPPTSIMEFTAEATREIPVDAIGGSGPNNPYDEEIHHFLACLKTGEPFRISLDEARLAVSTVQRLIAGGTLP